MEATRNVGLFRIYAVCWLFAALAAVMIVVTAIQVPTWATAGYAAIAVTLWAANKVFIARGQTEHVLAHDITTAAAALVWPLVLAGLAIYLMTAVVAGLKSEGGQP